MKRPIKAKRETARGFAELHRRDQFRATARFMRRIARKVLRAPPDEKDAPSSQKNGATTEKPKEPGQLSPSPAFLQALMPGAHLNSLPVKEAEALALNVFIAAGLACRDCGESFNDMAVAGFTEVPYVLAFMRGALCTALLLQARPEPEHGKNGKNEAAASNQEKPDGATLSACWPGSQTQPEATGQEWETDRPANG